MQISKNTKYPIDINSRFLNPIPVLKSKYFWMRIVEYFCRKIFRVRTFQSHFIRNLWMVSFIFLISSIWHVNLKLLWALNPQITCNIMDKNDLKYFWQSVRLRRSKENIAYYHRGCDSRGYLYPGWKIRFIILGSDRVIFFWALCFERLRTP